MASMVRCAVLLLLAAAAHAADRYDWKQGTVAELTVNPPLTAVNAPVYLNLGKTYTYTVRDGDASYQARHKAKRAIAGLDSQVEYSLSEKHLYIRDSSGKVYKLTRVRSVIRRPVRMKSQAIS